MQCLQLPVFPLLCLIYCGLVIPLKKCFHELLLLDFFQNRKEGDGYKKEVKEVEEREFWKESCFIVYRTANQQDWSIHSSIRGLWLEQSLRKQLRMWSVRQQMCWVRENHSTSQQSISQTSGEHSSSWTMNYEHVRKHVVHCSWFLVSPLSVLCPYLVAMEEIFPKGSSRVSLRRGGQATDRHHRQVLQNHMNIWAGTVLSPKPPCLWMSLAYSDQYRISSQTCFRSDFSNVQCEMFLELYNNLKLPLSNCPPSLHPFHEYQACVEVWRFSLWASVRSGSLVTGVTSITAFVLLTVLNHFLEDPNLYAPHFFFPAIEAPPSIESMSKSSFESVSSLVLLPQPSSKLGQFHCSRTFLRAGKMATR